MSYSTLVRVRFVPKMAGKYWNPFKVIGVAETACQFEKVKVTFVLHHKSDFLFTLHQLHW